MAYTGFLSVSYADYDNEMANLRLHVAPITAANHDAQVALHAALRLAIAGISNGVLVKDSYGNEQKVNFGPASAPATQRELKYLVQYHDGVTLQRLSAEVPCADTATLDPNDRAHAQIGDSGVVDAFVDAFEDVVKSPAGNAVVIDEITLVGRQL